MDVYTKKYKILLIDDEQELADLYRMRLVSEGFEAQHCNNGETALTVAREFKPDLILLDIMMPRLSGFDAIDLFRNTMETSAAKIIILSALSQPEDIAKAKELGADDYIVKSDATIDDVIARIKKMLGISDAGSTSSPDGEQQAA